MRALVKSPSVVALVYCALILVVMEYALIPGRFEALWEGFGIGEWMTPTLTGGLGWVAGCWVGFLIIPIFIIKLSGGDLKNFGFHTKDFFSHLKIYIGFFILMLPLVYMASRQDSFRQVYPFIPEASRSLSHFMIWEIGYVSQFFCLEFFFRGYLLYTLEKESHHWMAIATMVVPYAMIHFHKPMLETFGAIGAGLILGHFSLKYRSWLGGAILHSLVAVSMDSLSVFGSR
jgi:uncharacterized protein